MYFFAASEAFFFLALIIAYVFYRQRTHTEDTVIGHLNVIQASVLTGCLLLSSGCLWWGHKNLQKQNIRLYRTGMGSALLLGMIFFAGQIKEYHHLYQEQITLHQDIFGASFFTLTGFHGLHVLLGLLAMAILFGCSFNHYKIVSRAAMGGLEVYWHFVDLVWLFVFFFVYLKPLLWP